MARIPLTLAMSLAALSLGTVASAQPRYPRVQPEVEPVTLSASVLPPVTGPAPAQARGPSVDASMLMGLGVMATRPEQEQILATLIQETPDSEVEEKASYYHRLAAFYASEQRRWMTLSAPSGSNEARQAAQHGKLSLLKAVKTFKGLLDNDRFRNYVRRDEAMFQYGVALAIGKYMKEARAVFDKLLKEHPTSVHVPSAHVVFADYYFDAAQYADAELRYKQVLKFPKAAVYGYAMYKLGWIHVRMGRVQEALEAFVQVVSDTRRNPVHAAQAALAAAARRDYVLAYAEIGKADRAYEAFQRVDKDAATELTVMLAAHLGTRAAHDAELAAYRQLVARAPDDIRACDWQYRLARGVLASQASTDDKLAAIEALVAVYVKRRNGGVRDDSECAAYAAEMSGELADAYHAEWSKTGNTKTLEYATRLYSTHLGAFRSLDAARQRRRAAAEALWSLAAAETDAKLRRVRWTRAKAAFLDASDDVDAADAPELRRAAALAALNAIDFVAPTDAAKIAASASLRRKRGRAAASRDETQILALSRFVTAGEGADDEDAIARIALAIELRDAERFDEAADILDAFLERHATHASAEVAAVLLLDSLARSKGADLALVVDGMTADLTFLTGKPVLARELGKLRRAR